MSKLPKRPIKSLEDRVTHLLSEWLNDSAPLGEERYREPAKAAVKEVADEALRIVLEWEKECTKGKVGWQPIVERIRALSAPKETKKDG